MGSLTCGCTDTMKCRFHVPVKMNEIYAKQFDSGSQWASAMLNICHNIKLLRKRHGMTQAQLAHKSNVPQSRISDLETYVPNSDPGIKVLSRIAEALGVTVVDLISSPRQNYTPTTTRRGITDVGSKGTTGDSSFRVSGQLQTRGINVKNLTDSLS